MRIPNVLRWRNPAPSLRIILFVNICWNQCELFLPRVLPFSIHIFLLVLIIIFRMQNWYANSFIPCFKFILKSPIPDARTFLHISRCRFTRHKCKRTFEVVTWESARCVIYTKHARKTLMLSCDFQHLPFVTGIAKSADQVYLLHQDFQVSSAICLEYWSITEKTVSRVILYSITNKKRWSNDWEVLNYGLRNGVLLPREVLLVWEWKNIE